MSRERVSFYAKLFSCVGKGVCQLSLDTISATSPIWSITIKKINMSDSDKEPIRDLTGKELREYREITKKRSDVEILEFLNNLKQSKRK